MSRVCCVDSSEKVLIIHVDRYDDDDDDDELVGNVVRCVVVIGWFGTILILIFFSREVG